MYNRPIHIYSYGTGGVCSLINAAFHLSNWLPFATSFLLTKIINVEPINIFHRGYNTDTPPIRLSYHHGNHYNSLVDPRRLTIGAGLGFSCLRGVRFCFFCCYVYCLIIMVVLLFPCFNYNDSANLLPAHKHDRIGRMRVKGSQMYTNRIVCWHLISGNHIASHAIKLGLLHALLFIRRVFIFG